VSGLTGTRKSPWRMSVTRKRRQRHRLRDVDAVMATLAEGMEKTNQTCRALDRALLTWRNESDMPARDKYWVFSKKDRESNYRKGAHKVPKWTRLLPVFLPRADSVGCPQGRCRMAFRSYCDDLKRFFRNDDMTKNIACEYGRIIASWSTEITTIPRHDSVHT
jgi:hypothetical protein